MYLNIFLLRGEFWMEFVFDSLLTTSHVSNALDFLGKDYCFRFHLVNGFHLRASEQRVSTTCHADILRGKSWYGIDGQLTTEFKG